MTKLLLIRHAETDMAGTFCGHSDPELNALGLSLLPDLVDELRCWPIREIYSSDLRRAKQTADAIATYFQVKCTIRKELREINFGRWEGLRWNDIVKREPAEAERWIQNPNQDFPDGEGAQSFLMRVSKEISIYTTNPKGTIAIVTHAGFMRAALTRSFGMSEGNAWDCTRKYRSVVIVDSSLAIECRSFERIA